MARAAALSCLFFALVVLAVPALKGPAYEPGSASISEGALGAWGWLQSLAFLVLGGGSLLLAYSVRDAWSGRPGGVAAVLLALWGVAVLLCGVFRVDAGAKGETGAAKTHLLAAVLAFVALLAAMWVATFAFRASSGSWSSWSTPSLLVTAVATLAFGVMAAAPQESSWGGYAQRGFVGVVLAWLAGVALVAA